MSPYIIYEERDRYEHDINELVVKLESRGWPVGEVTYVIYKIVVHWFAMNQAYSTICAIRGVLAGVIEEFNRRPAADYEDHKLHLNGDV